MGEPAFDRFYTWYERCLACGLVLEIRPVDPERASAFDLTCETPAPRG